MTTIPQTAPDLVAQMLNRAAAAAGLSQFRAMMDKPVERLQHQFEEGVVRREADPELDAERILGYIHAAERAAARILRVHSWYYWLMLSRRIFPDVSAYPSYQASTVPIARDIMTALIIRYGRRSPRDTARRADGTTTPKAVALRDALGIYQVDRLAFEIALSAAAFRRLNKGGALTLTPGDHWQVRLPDETQHLLRLLDDRTQRFAGMLAPFGFPKETTDRLDILHVGTEHTGDGLFAVVAIYNLMRLAFPLTHIPRAGQPRSITFTPNFLLCRADLEPLYEKLGWFYGEFRQGFGSDPRQVVAFLTAVARTYQTEAQKSNWYIHHVMITGYRMITHAFVEEITHAYRSVMRERFNHEVDEPEATSAVNRLMDRFTVTRRSFRGLHIGFDPLPGFIVRARRVLLLDLSVISDTLLGLPGFIAEVGGKVGRRRGNRAEREVFEAIRARLRTATVYWEPGVHVFNRLGEEIGEIDGAFRKGQTLFVIETKANRTPLGFKAATRAEVGKRWRKLQEDLEKLDRKCHRMAVEGAEIGGIRWIVPVLCTAFPAFVPFKTTTDGRELFLTEKIPRIATVSEVSSFLNGIRPSALRKRSYVYEVSRRHSAQPTHDQA